MMREDPEIVEHFVSYYLALGADSVLVYHDGPADQMARPADPRAEIILCDAAFWERLGGKPEGVEDRQSAVYADGLARCGADWVLICDADEFVFGDRPVEQFLDWLPESVDSARLRTAEAVWGPEDSPDRPFGSTWFRTSWSNLQFWKALRRIVYGADTRFFRQGLVGHVAGKQFLRAGRAYDFIGNHYTERDGVNISVWAHELGRGGAGMYLGHFDAIGLGRWRRKWEQRITRETIANRMAGTRNAQMGAIAAALEAGEPATRSIFLRLYALSPWQARILAALGYAFQRDIFRHAPAEEAQRRSA
jgi:hypothetical protein